MVRQRWTVEDLAARHPRVAIDADVLIYLLDGSEPRATLAAAVIDAADQGVFKGSVSALAVAEVLVGPARGGDAARFEETASELRDLAIDIVPVSGAIAEDAAWLRGQRQLQLADALHVATARTVATAFVTNDRRIRSLANLEVLYIDDLEA
jgi:predicted nucleic acid-binding protein